MHAYKCLLVYLHTWFGIWYRIWQTWLLEHCEVINCANTFRCGCWEVNVLLILHPLFVTCFSSLKVIRIFTLFLQSFNMICWGTGLFNLNLAVCKLFQVGNLCSTIPDWFFFYTNSLIILFLPFYWFTFSGMTSSCW